MGKWRNSSSSKYRMLTSIPINRILGHWRKHNCDNGCKGISEELEIRLLHALRPRKKWPRRCLPNYCLFSCCLWRSHSRTLVEKLEDVGDLDPSSLNTKFEILLRDVLSAVTANVRSPILIVFDALNECGTPETRPTIMNILYNDPLTLPSNFRFLITARPEGDHLPFMYLPTCRVRILNLDNRMGESRLDVKRYIESEMEKLKSSNALVIPQGWDWDGGKQSLTNTADGLFIWASTAIKFISKRRFNGFCCLKDLVENRNKLDLNELYATILRDAFESVHISFVT